MAPWRYARYIDNLYIYIHVIRFEPRRGPWCFSRRSKMACGIVYVLTYIYIYIYIYRRTPPYPAHAHSIHIKRYREIERDRERKREIERDKERYRDIERDRYIEI